MYIKPIKLHLDLEKLIFVNIFFLFVIPQLNNVHYDPLPQFWAEISAVCGIISLFFITISYTQKILIPRFAILILVFIVYLLIQQQIKQLDFVGLMYVACLEFLLCFILAICMVSIEQKIGLDKLSYYITISILIGSIIQSLIGLLQYTGLYKYLGDLIFYDSAHPTTDIFGHFGQRNHYCHYLTWGIFATIYLFFKNKISRPIFLIIIVWLTFSLTIAGSRSILLYFATSIIIFSLFALKNKALTRPLITICTISIFILLFGYLYPIMIKLFTHIHQVDSGVTRLSTESAEGGLIGRRMTEWLKAIVIFKQHPLIGAGWNTFAHNSVYLQPLFPNAPQNSGLFTNCHNLILQLLAETGIIGLVIILYSLCLSIYNLIKNKCLETAIILSMAFTTIDHSMLEYPLWYLYFLAPFIMFLSIKQNYWIFKMQRTLITILATLVICLIPIIIINSITFEHLVDINDPPTDKNEFKNNIHYLMQLSNKQILWTYPSLYVLDNYNNVDNKLTDENLSIKEQLDLVTRFTNYHPYPMDLINQAMLNWKVGNKKLAFDLVNLALIAYPVYKETYLSTLKDKRYKELYKIVANFNKSTTP